MHLGNQHLRRASGLNLLVTAIILWNSRYLAAAFDNFETRAQPLTPEIKKHIAPLGWEHISLTGDYVWSDQRQPTAGQLRPLRRPPSPLQPEFRVRSEADPERSVNE